eukprot:6466186-Amphidinium_carterae.2
MGLLTRRSLHVCIFSRSYTLAEFAVQVLDKLVSLLVILVDLPLRLLAVLVVLEQRLRLCKWLVFVVDYCRHCGTWFAGLCRSNITNIMLRMTSCLEDL